MKVSESTTMYQAATKMLQGECSTMGDHELVSALFCVGAEEANQLLFNAGSLRNLVETSALGKALIEFSARYYSERAQRGNVLEDPEAVRFYLASKLRDIPHEVFACIFLDNRHRVIKYEEMFRGTIDGASVYPREVVKAALKHNAAAVIIAHNHPSGVAEPSQSDERITQKLRNALALIDVRVLDHLVVGDQIVSFVERGLL